MADLSQYSTEELMQMKGATSKAPAADLSSYSTEELMKMKVKPSIGEDVVKSLPGVVPRAASGLIGFPQSMVSMGDKAYQYIGEKLGIAPEKVQAGIEKFDGAIPGGGLKLLMRKFPNLGEVSAHGWDEISKIVTGDPLYKPQTGPGRIVDTTLQTMVSGPGSMVQKGVMGVAAGVSGEAARQVTQNPILIGLAQMLGAGVASIPFIARSVPSENIDSALQGVSQKHLDAAQKLMDDARKMGTPLTGAEALSQVVGRNKLQDIQRVIEGSKEGGTITEPMMNARPEANRAAYSVQADKIAAMPARPSETPVQLQETAQQAITTARKAGNAAAKPLYDAAAQQKVPSQEWNSLTTDPAVQKALQAVKSDPIWGVANEAEGSIRWLDAAKKWIDGELTTANPSVSRIWEGANGKIKAVADAVSPEYAQARATVAQNMQNVVRPLENSPVGDIARTGAPPGKPRPSGETMMAKQSGILMPESPKALNPITIRDTVASLQKQNPDVAAQWTRQNLESIFNEAAQNNAGGVNQWGGAKFAAKVSGNVTQKDNLRALVESTSGNQAWVGFNRMLEVMEAQGKRLAPGSNTARDLATAENLASVGGVGGTAARVMSPGSLSTAVYDWYQNFRYGKNTAEMARILTDPKSVDLMKALAKEAPNTAKAQAIVGEIVAGASAGQTDAASR